MRFALVATSVVAAIALPFASAAIGPRMSDDQFINAVRCTAYVSVLEPQADLGMTKLQLNAEALRQPAEVTAYAHNQVNAILARAVDIANPRDAAMMRMQREHACLNATMLAGTANGGAG